MALQADDKFAGYTIIRKIGAGGMGEVYLAQHPRLPRRDALKLLAANVSADEEFRERFLREADLASTLWHPHIVGVHDRGEFHGQLWLSMDYVDGEDAATLLAQQYRTGMPVDLVVAIVSAVGSALDYAHGQGLLHRDIKPANILLAAADDKGQQRILLGDFGIARTMDDKRGLTGTNVTVGTVDYVAPEQLMGLQLDGRADQYALAATAYHLLTGTTLFNNTNAAVVIGHHLNSAPPPLAATRPELAAFDSVLAIALAKEPSQRYPTCTDFAQALAAQVGRQAAAPTMAAAVPSFPAPAPTAPSAVSPVLPAGDHRTRWILLSFIAFGVLALVTGYLVVANSSQSPLRDAAPASTVTIAPPSMAVPVAPVEAPATVTVTRSTAVTVTPPIAPTRQPTGIVVGTCDEGGSCGVQQRVAPLTSAGRMYPDVLKDGMTVAISCQTSGDIRTSAGHGSSRTWLRLTNGAFVNSVYLDIEATWIPTC